MATWKITGHGIAGSAEGKSFQIALNVDGNTWTASGADVALFLSTTSGSYKIVGLPERGTQLVSPKGVEAAFLTNLTGTSAVGATGNGRTEEEKITWKLDGKL